MTDPIGCSTEEAGKSEQWLWRFGSCSSAAAAGDVIIGAAGPRPFFFSVEKRAVGAAAMSVNTVPVWP